MTSKIKQRLYETLKAGSGETTLMDLRAAKLDELVNLEQEAKKVRKQIEFIDKQIK